MLFKREICYRDEELGLLKAKTSVLETSSLKWKKRIQVLGFNLDLLVSGTPERLNNTQRKIIIKALNDKNNLENQVLCVIKWLCKKNRIKPDEWESYFRCSSIFIDKVDLYITIEDILNNLSYELELKWY